MFHNIFSKNKNADIKKPKVKITVDNREKNSLVIAELYKLNFEIEFKQLPVADYLINNVAIERKTISDFKSSIINKRLPKQLQEMKQYPKHIIILEGFDYDIYKGSLHENAFRGFILTTLLEANVPIIFSLNEADTAKYLSVLARKRQKSENSIRPTKTFLSEKDQLQFILEGFPAIGPVTAKKLLKKFKTIKQIANTPLEDLHEIIGKKANLMHKLFTKKYS